jgi:DNA-binding transcriptional MerR regulator
VTAGAATTPERSAVGFTALQAARLTDASRVQLETWSRAGLTAPGPEYEFDDLVAVRVIVALLDAGLPLTLIRPALVHVRASDGALRLVTDGDFVRPCRTDTEVLAALARCPLALVVDIGHFVAATEAAVTAFDAEREGFVESLRVG